MALPESGPSKPMQRAHVSVTVLGAEDRVTEKGTPGAYGYREAEGGHLVFLVGHD